MFSKLLLFFFSLSKPDSAARLIFQLNAVAILFIFYSCNPDEKKYVFNLGHLANEDHTWHLATVYFDSILNVRSDGRIRVNVYPSEQLGKEVEMIRGIKAGIADMTITAGTLQNWSPIATFSEMPFLIRDTTTANFPVSEDSWRILNSFGLVTPISLSCSMKFIDCRIHRERSR